MRSQQHRKLRFHSPHQKNINTANPHGPLPKQSSEKSSVLVRNQNTLSMFTFYSLNKFKWGCGLKYASTPKLIIRKQKCLFYAHRKVLNTHQWKTTQVRGIHLTLVKRTYQCNPTLEFKERETTRGNSKSLMQCIFQQFELRSIKRPSLLIIIVSAVERLVLFIVCL